MQEKEFRFLVEKLPYTKPFLLISGLQLVSGNLHIVTWHEYHAEDTLVRSHFGGQFIAGTLITEQICQTALLLLIKQFGEKPLPPFFLGKINSDYLFPVQPGKVSVKVNVSHHCSSYTIFHGTAWVDKTKVAVVKGGVQIDS